MDTKMRDGASAAALTLVLAVGNLAYLVFNDGCPADPLFLLWLPLFLLNPVVLVATIGSLGIAYFAGNSFGWKAHVVLSLIALVLFVATTIWAHAPHSAPHCGPYP